MMSNKSNNDSYFLLLCIQLYENNEHLSINMISISTRYHNYKYKIIQSTIYNPDDIQVFTFVKWENTEINTKPDNN